MSSRRRSTDNSVVLRFANDCDDVALHRLAELDSTVVPSGRLLLAEVDGALRAAYAPEHDAVIADPFHATADLITLLRAHAVPTGRRGATGARAPGGIIRRAPWPA